MHGASDSDRAARPPQFVGSDIYRTSIHGSGHPLAIPRVSLVIDLCRALGWLPDAVYHDCPPASAEQIARYHDRDYVDAVIAAERDQDIPEDVRRRHNIGINGHPLYAEMFRRPATACGGSIMSARLLAEPGVVYHPAGGTHHGQPARASGFCTFNDPVLGILAFLDAGLSRVFYLDLDAHFGDGVQAAFADDDRVFTLSVHEAGRWPMVRSDGIDVGPGSLGDRGGGRSRNLPVPEGFHDVELEFLVETVIVPLITEFAPEALVVQGGCDALADDPMTHLALSNTAFWRTVATLRPLAPRLLLLGGGGYNPYAVGRCWAGNWAVLNGYEIPDRLPDEAESSLRSVRWNHRRGRTPPAAWFTTLADVPRLGPVRAEVRDIAARALRAWAADGPPQGAAGPARTRASASALGG